jgi:hypothetical protein
MEEDYETAQRRARRREAKRQHLGSSAPRCLSCGCLEVEALTAVPISALPGWFLEQNHLAKRSGSDFTVTLCRNCHAVLTDWQEDWEPRLRDPHTAPERLAALLQGSVDWQLQLAKKHTEFAARQQMWVRWFLRGMDGPAPP